MAQGKMKVKTKLPSNVRKASVHRGAWNVQKSKVTKSKKTTGKTFGQKLQNEVTKEIAKTIETQARGLAEKYNDSTKLDKKKTK